MHLTPLRRLAPFIVVIALLHNGCDDDAADSGNRASSGTTPRAAPATSPATIPAAEVDTGARATGGVFESPPSTQPARR